MERSSINYVFIDFENVQEVDLAVPGDKPLSITLLVGEKQKTLKTDLVEQLLKRAAQVQMVRLGASGKNALDFALAYHLGRAVATDPTGFFHIVSKDKGFEPLIAHLKQQHIRVYRHDAFSAISSLTATKPTVVSPVSAPALSVVKDRVAEFIDNLKHHATNRPKRKTTLLAHLKSHFGGLLNDAELAGRFEEVRKRTGLTIDAKGAVTYPTF
jgi:hypothetical protein